MSEISNGTIGRPKILGKILAKELEIIRNEVKMIPNFVEWCNWIKINGEIICNWNNTDRKIDGGLHWNLKEN